MAVSPDDRFAGLISSSAERGGWVPGDVFASDSEGEEEPVEPRRVRLPVLVAVAVAMVAVLIVAFLLLRPAQQHSAGEQQGSSVGGDAGAGASGTDDSAASGTAAGGGTDSSAGGAQKSGAQSGGAQSGAAQSGTAQASGEVVVHVTGQVHKPSVVTLDAGARVQDAVEAAGGLKSDADAEAINLARVLQDGEQVHIPARGENADADSDADSGGGSAGAGTSAGSGGNPGTGSSTSGAGSSGRSSAGGSADSVDGAGADGANGSAGAGPNVGGKIDLNTADSTALQTLPGVGPVTAEAIVTHRQDQPFASVEDLLLVQGIGPKTYERLKDLVTVG